MANKSEPSWRSRTTRFVAVEFQLAFAGVVQCLDDASVAPVSVLTIRSMGCSALALASIPPRVPLEEWPAHGYESNLT